MKVHLKPKQLYSTDDDKVNRTDCAEMFKKSTKLIIQAEDSEAPLDTIESLKKLKRGVSFEVDPCQEYTIRIEITPKMDIGTIKPLEKEIKFGPYDKELTDAQLKIIKLTDSETQDIFFAIVEQNLTVSWTKHICGQSLSVFFEGNEQHNKVFNLTRGASNSVTVNTPSCQVFDNSLVETCLTHIANDSSVCPDNHIYQRATMRGIVSGPVKEDFGKIALQGMMLRTLGNLMNLNCVEWQNSEVAWFNINGSLVGSHSFDYQFDLANIANLIACQEYTVRVITTYRLLESDQNQTMIVFEENLITNTAGRFIEVSVSVDDEGIKINGEPCQFDYKLTLTDDNRQSKNIDSSRIQNGSVGFKDLDVVKDALVCHSSQNVQLFTSI